VTESRYRTAFLDWLACAVRGASEPAARAAAGAADAVAAVGTAGHVLDFDDTYLPGLAHLSAPSASAALVVGAEQARTLGDVLAAYAEGFEAMGAVARASHPALYNGHYHPTAVCGGVGAAVAAGALIGLSDHEPDDAVAIALVGAAGLRAAFGSQGKSLQVGLAAAGGVRAARLARAGARVPLARAARGFADATGGAFERPDSSSVAIDENWIKAWPCCLQTHGAIEAAAQVGEPRSLTVTVHPVSLQAASYGPRPADGLEAKFSIPYCTAWTLLNGPPIVESFQRVDDACCELAETIAVETDSTLLESECFLSANGDELARVKAALGSPGQPMDEHKLAAKVGDLAGAELVDLMHDPGRPAAELLARVIRS
jgi:2-methylcitrate dehydratase PrpD